MGRLVKSLGFGFNPLETQHHFLVTVPTSRSGQADVVISEHYCWHDNKTNAYRLSFSDPENQIKVTIKRWIWNLIADQIKFEFNQRLKELKLTTGLWKKSGAIPINRTLGKELVLLCWALEDSNPDLIPAALCNWLGLAPEERWWLYTMTNAACGDSVRDKNRGWRRAIRYALTDNPISERVLNSRAACFENKIVRDSIYA